MEKQTLNHKESIWYYRVKKYIEDYQEDSNYVCSWWLRIEHENDSNPLSTSQINYILSKVAEKGWLTKETTKSYTKFTLIY